MKGILSLGYIRKLTCYIFVSTKSYFWKTKIFWVIFLTFYHIWLDSTDSHNTVGGFSVSQRNLLFSSVWTTLAPQWKNRRRGRLLNFILTFYKSEIPRDNQELPLKQSFVSQSHQLPLPPSFPSSVWCLGVLGGVAMFFLPKCN